jgi:transcriptional regulator with XRE-family HTH domain
MVYTVNMGRPKTRGISDFGRNLARLRKAAGYTQAEFSKEIGISRRSLAYYEAEGGYPSAELLAASAKAFGVSTDEMLQATIQVDENIEPRLKNSQSRLERRLSQIERLPQAERRQLMQIIDSFLERQKYRNNA